MGHRPAKAIAAIAARCAPAAVLRCALLLAACAWVESVALAQQAKATPSPATTPKKSPLSDRTAEAPETDVDLSLGVRIHRYRSTTVDGFRGGGPIGDAFSRTPRVAQVRFIRLEHSGDHWSRNFGVGADLNMLIEYGFHTKHKVAKQTESRTVKQLKNFPLGKSPPVFYLTGTGVKLSTDEVQALREYLLTKHGMLFADAGGNDFHAQFVKLMAQVLPEVRQETVPATDRIHRSPLALDHIPAGAAHGEGPLGWKVDGRWVCYYHPGDLGSLWADGHSGYDKAEWEAAYQLGTNVISYAISEYRKWDAERKANSSRSKP